MKFGSRQEAYIWIIVNQLSRRNCTPETRDYLVGIRYRCEKRSRGRPPKSGHNDHLKTASKMAAEMKVGEKTIRRAAEFADAVDTVVSAFPPRERKTVKNRLLLRDTSLNRKDILELAQLPSKHIRDVIDKGTSLWEARSAANRTRKTRAVKQATKLILPKDIQLSVGDCLELSKKMKPASVDCIVTDPPYADVIAFDKLG